jgi:hypothetical protein
MARGGVCVPPGKEADNSTFHQFISASLPSSSLDEASFSRRVPVEGGREKGEWWWWWWWEVDEGYI